MDLKIRNRTCRTNIWEGMVGETEDEEGMLTKSYNLIIPLSRPSKAWSNSGEWRGRHTWLRLYLGDTISFPV